MLRLTVKFKGSEVITETGFGREEKLTPNSCTPQDKPRRYYVYAHVAPNGKYFYIGKGIGERAWSKDRHPLWYRYVNNHLKGQFSVLILEDNLSSEEAETHESDWIDQEGESLVNWTNDRRKFDYTKLDHFHKLRNANRELINQAKMTEKTNINSAIPKYLQAISAIEQYAFLEFESGLVGQLLKEERNELGYSGEIEAIDRLSLCLIKIGQIDEAKLHVDNYFNKFAANSNLTTAERIKNRVEKALLKKESN